MALRQTQGPGFPCTLSELVELAVISCSWTGFESDEGVALRQTQGPGFPCTLSELVELAVISCSGTSLIPPIRGLAFTGKNHISTHYRHSLRKQGI